MRRSTCLGPASVGVLALVLVGCGGAKTKVDVTGTVSYQGKPIENGAIRFEPIDRKLQPSGDNIRNGVYRVTLPVGTAKITITGSEKIGMKKLYPTPDSPTRPIFKQFVPDKYNDKTELSAEITSGTSRLDFDLK
jgi:hypothetical protein